MIALLFMVGYWQSTDPSGKTEEELWLPERGNMMLGLHRSVYGLSGDFEYMRIENRKLGITLVALPRAEKATEFQLVRSGKNEAVFENLAHDFPQRIRYWLDDKGQLHAKIEDKAGKKAQEWTWQKAPL